MPNIQQGIGPIYPQPEVQRTNPTQNVAPTPPTSEAPVNQAVPVSEPPTQTPAQQTPGQTAQQDGQNAVTAYKTKEPRLSLLTGYSFSPNYSGSVDGAQKLKVGLSYTAYQKKFDKEGDYKLKLDVGVSGNYTSYQQEVTDPATGYTKEKDKSSFGVDLDAKAKFQMKVAKFNQDRNFLFVTPTAMGSVGVNDQGKFNYQYGGGASFGVANNRGWSFGIDANYTNKGGFVGGTLVVPIR